MTEVKVYARCGCCDHFHRPDYWGDCRNDDERFTFEDLDAKHGTDGWDYTENEDNSGDAIG